MTMVRLTWIRILTGLCVGLHLSTVSLALRLARVIQTSQNVSLACNLTSSTDITWYRLQGDRMQPLLTVTVSKFGEDMENSHTGEKGHFTSRGHVINGTNSLEIVNLEEDDGGLYFCSGSMERVLTVSRGIQLSIDGHEGASSQGGAPQPCWTLGVCLLPALLLVCCLIIVSLYLWKGKSGVCWCKTKRSNTDLRVAEDVCLHYSSVQHPYKPRPPRRPNTGLVREDVTYSTVNN